jgi:hypothetical protein
VWGSSVYPLAEGLGVRVKLPPVQPRSWLAHEVAPLDDLVRELRMLAEAAPKEIETKLRIHPRVLTDFLDYNDFLHVADAAVEE